MVLPDCWLLIKTMNDLDSIYVHERYFPPKNLLTPLPMESQMEFCSTQNISGASSVKQLHYYPKGLK